MLFNRNGVSKLGWIRCRRHFSVINDNRMTFDREQRKPSASRPKTSYVACGVLRVKLRMLEDNHQVFIHLCSLKKNILQNAHEIKKSCNKLLTYHMFCNPQEKHLLSEIGKIRTIFTIKRLKQLGSICHFLSRWIIIIILRKVIFMT